MDHRFDHFKPISDRNRFSLDADDWMRPVLTGLTVMDSYHDSKTVIIPDAYLPPKWSKHAYRNFGAWLTFLLTPDGYRIETYDELDNYYHVKYNKSRPITLDFSLDEDLIPHLMLRQENMVPLEFFQYWEIQYIPKEKTKVISYRQDENVAPSCSHWPISYPNSSRNGGVENVSMNTPSWDVLDDVDPYTLTGNILDSDSDELPSLDSEEIVTHCEPERPVLKPIDTNQNALKMDLNAKSIMPKSPVLERAAASVRSKDSVLINHPEKMKEINRMYQFMGNTRNIPKEIYCAMSIDGSHRGSQSYKPANKAYQVHMVNKAGMSNKASTSSTACTSNPANKPWLKLPPSYQESTSHEQMNNDVTKMPELMIEKVFICSCGQEVCNSWEPSIQCAKCLTWQHTDCMVDEGLNVDSDYACFICSTSQQDSDSSSPDEKRVKASKELKFAFQQRKPINEKIREEHRNFLTDVNDVIHEAEEIRQKLSQLRHMITIYEETMFPNELLGISWNNSKNQKAWKRLIQLKQHYDITYEPENISSYPNYLKYQLLDYIEERKREIVNEAMDLKYDLDCFEPYEGEDFTRLRECSQKVISRLKENLEALKNACDL